jgi:formylglycine-generating enzyme required for sulfatase activity
VPKIFSSYRREDSVGVTGRVYDRLGAHFGRDCVFMDVDAIPFGVDFRQHLTNAVSECDVLLAVIGEQWLTVSHNGQPRLQDAKDFVRIEIEAALQRGIPVIPVLLGKTSMPREDELPAALAPLVFRNAAPVDPGRDFHSHIDRLIRGLDHLAGKAGTTTSETPPKKPTRKAGEILTNSIGMKLAWIPPGKFLIGSPDKEPERGKDERQHEVEITRGFYMGVYPVTQEEYAKVMKATPSYFASTGKGKDNVAGMDTKRFPVEQVSWRDALEFCRRLGELEPGKNYDLPTEAEWEYACRAGSVTAFSFGANLSSRQANFNQGLGRTCAVGAYPANVFGLFDMHGNVWEWCKDCYDAAYYDKSPISDPECTQGENRVLRGGAWNYRTSYCRCAYRNSYAPDYRGFSFGFRVVLSSLEHSARIDPNA